MGTQIVQEPDANNELTRRYYEEGEERIGGRDGGPYYYTRDHLRSIRELTDGSGAAHARYDYDPYGKQTKLGGALDVDFGYTGHYFHAPSGLNLAPYRAYNPALGRWLSRDPIGEEGGLNLYGYVGNNPIILVDPTGEIWVEVVVGILVVAIIWIQVTNIPHPPLYTEPPCPPRPILPPPGGEGGGGPPGGPRPPPPGGGPPPWPGPESPLQSGNRVPSPLGPIPSTNPSDPNSPFNSRHGRVRHGRSVPGPMRPPPRVPAPVRGPAR